LKKDKDKFKRYIRGYYCKDDVDLKILNKTSNREMLNVLLDAYPKGLDAKSIHEKSKLPEQTIYAQQAELYFNYYIHQVDERSRKRHERHARRVIIDQTKDIYDEDEGKNPIPLPPGNVFLDEHFKKVLSILVDPKEHKDLNLVIIQYLQRIYDRIRNHEDKDVRMWIPKRDIEFCCTRCGLNHEARDFMRAMLISIIDEVEDNCKFVELMKENDFITPEAYERIKQKCKN
jgi:hypothetical protein